MSVSQIDLVIHSLTNGEFVALWMCMAQRRDPHNLDCRGKVEGIFGLSDLAQSIHDIYLGEHMELVTLRHR